MLQASAAVSSVAEDVLILAGDSYVHTVDLVYYSSARLHVVVVFVGGREQLRLGHPERAGLRTVSCVTQYFMSQ